MKQITVYYRIIDGQDGSVSLEWYRTPKEARTEEKQDNQPFEDAISSIRVAPGSKILEYL